MIKIFKNHEVKNGIVSGIIASTIFLIIITPIFKGLWSLFLSISNQTLNNYLDNIFKKAAQGSTDSLLYTIFGMILSIYILSLIFIFNFNPSNRRDQKSKIKPVDTQKPLVKGIEELAIEKYKAKKKIKLLEFLIKVLKLVRLLIILYSIFYILSLIFSVTSNYVMNKEFQQRLNILLPYINDQEEEELKSEWAAMQNQDDYLIIINDMNQFAAKNNLKLPESSFK